MLKEDQPTSEEELRRKICSIIGKNITIKGTSWNRNLQIIEGLEPEIIEKLTKENLENYLPINVNVILESKNGIPIKVKEGIIKKPDDTRFLGERY